MDEEQTQSGCNVLLFYADLCNLEVQMHRDDGFRSGWDGNRRGRGGGCAYTAAKEKSNNKEFVYLLRKKTKIRPLVNFLFDTKVYGSRGQIKVTAFVPCTYTQHNGAQQNTTEQYLIHFSTLGLKWCVTVQSANQERPESC